MTQGEAMLRAMINATPHMVWCADGMGNGDYFNDRMLEFTGQPLAALLGHGWAGLVHPADQPAVWDAWTRAIGQRSALSIEFRFRHHSGQYRWVLCRGEPVVDAATGSIVRGTGTCTDIHEHKVLAAELRDARQRLQATLSAGNIGTWNWDLARDLLHADGHMKRLFGLEHTGDDPLTPEALMAAIHPDDAPAVRSRAEHAVATRGEFSASCRVVLAHGGTRHVHARGKVELNEAGKPRWLPGAVMDVTELHASQEELRTREERYRALFNSIAEGFAIIELCPGADGEARDYRFLEVNPALETITGLKGVLGKTLREVVPEPNLEWVARYAEVARTGEPQQWTGYSQALQAWYDLSVVRVHAGSRAQVALLFADVSERKRSDEALRRLADDLALANRRQREFLATLAHELRNPLAPIRNGLEVLRLAGDDPVAVARLRDMMGRQVDHLVHLVEDLLDLARVASGKIELKRGEVVLQSVLAHAVEAVSPLLRERRHRFTCDVPEEPVRLFADAHRLVQVVVNLLTNAAKYTPEGGVVSLRAWRDDGEAVVTVMDNGIGIASAALPHLFDMFSQVDEAAELSQGGLGIGLNLVKRLAEKHGGSVEAASGGSGLGATFTLRLPVDRRRDEGNGVQGA